MNWTIRDERKGDEAAIRSLVEGAFADHAHSSGIEPDIIERLRHDRSPMLALVAEQDGAIVGHITFSPVTISDGTQGWFGLGPLSVEPAAQNGGIGSALCETGLDRLRKEGAAGCTVLGDPGYYVRFGFAHDPALIFPGVPAEYFQRIVFSGKPPTGEVSYAPAFG